MSPALSETLLVEGGDPLAASLVRNYFSSNPKIAQAFQSAKARVAIFGPAPGETGSAASFFAAMQGALDAVEASLQPTERPVYLAWTTVPAIVRTNAFELRRDSNASTRAPEQVRLVTKRGPFLGYLAVGEGGLAFFDATGRCCGNQPRHEDVIRALDWAWETTDRRDDGW